MQELRGMPVVNALAEKFTEEIKTLGQKGITPKLTVVKIGEREDDISYEKGILKRFASVDALVEVIALPGDCSQEKLEETIVSLNNDAQVHGILLFRPLPKNLSEDRIKVLIAEDKDVDCMGMANMANVFIGNKKGYAPCTAQAVVEILDHYGIDVAGKKLTIVGRSLVVGKPLAMMLLGRNATVTLCHTKTLNLAAECRKAQILVACAGVAKMIKADFTNPEQIVIDVGINVVDDKLGSVN
ncbi:MAG: bifunctional 5,10-methylenetetrahydrofolate dehydrogenase/5,10-methenyltetrahydrofolate cyclohydrolase [Saccharofermentanales bacterium]